MIEELKPQFLTETTLQQEIEQIASDHSLTYIESLMYFCEENDVDVEDLVPVISVNLKEKIRVDAMNDGLLPKQSMLPL